MKVARPDFRPRIRDPHQRFLKLLIVEPYRFEHCTRRRAVRTFHQWPASPIELLFAHAFSVLLFCRYENHPASAGRGGF
jgi:hypothetical protein